jgi:alkanesulfonate monooxygenase SsuD/methylene tetrahydromethanopterin reductase-like flavin-dependent oxidoreductase (luciferase family)
MFDMRTPDFGASQREIYHATLEMTEYADAQGFEQVQFPEHHCLEDGMLPVPAAMGAAVGARTKRIAICLVIILPYHDPVDLAETIAVTDLICDGRLHVTLGAGFAPPEFKLFGKSMHDRGRLMDEGVDVIVRALAGERFTFGEREIFIRPLPAQRPPHLYLAGGVPAAAKRAAKFGLGFWPMVRPEKNMIPIYEEECRKLGRAPGRVLRVGKFVYVAEDPEAAWAEVGPHILHNIQVSRGISTSASPYNDGDSYKSARTDGLFRVLTPDECVELSKTDPLVLMPLVGGLPPKIGWKSLELFAAKVLPRVKSSTV